MSRDEPTSVWDVDVESWETKACHLVGRNLTEAEWETYFPKESYH